jgi:hypothetical protein
MTSPVDFISGPSTVSTCGNLMKGNTDSLTATCRHSVASIPAIASMLSPSIARVAILARGTPIALETNGTVREARGFTSST